ncbi:hypothetical protein [Nostoc sp. TCL26-01]|uniref:hypothetical protein n=1 Tax=Nostoc sp. TCL26-01 TaxID=2576904 RepID=UPI0015BA394F|nr:hypothetical protein [Nostoc sp. TCL26-01]QLE54963.1 hypothetical protein FD725_05200 [Nostoc sp. TCL26-01]
MKERKLIRWIHLISSVAIGTFVYSPWRNQAEFLLFMRILIIPVLTLTGLWMWKGQQIKQLLSSSQHQTKA